MLKSALRAALESARDPEYAAGAQAYMKSEMPYLGVRMPDLRRSWRDLFAAHPLETEAQFRTELSELWDQAEYREERYTALALLDRYPQWVSLPLLERLIVEGAWWDYVDTLARKVGALLRAERRVAGDMRDWSVDRNMWKRRVSIICQLGFKADTDLGLLYHCIERNLADREFFVRKAIGWALRDYAWHDPREVERYVRSNGERMSGLTRREATRNLSKLLV